MKKIIFILFLSNLLFSQTVNLDTNQILIGGQTKLTISKPISENFIWPEIDTILFKKNIEIIQKGKIDTFKNKIFQEFILTAWDSGKYYIPSINFSEVTSSKDIILNVLPLNIDPKAKLKDIKQPLKAPLNWHDIWPWILILIILIVFIFLINKYVLKKKKTEKKKINKKIIPCHIKALKELEEIERKQLWENGLIKEYYSEISEIFRRYLEERFSFNALEITTDEILEELKIKIQSKLFEETSILLNRSDLAKFAKNKPSKNDNINSLFIARKIINETKNKEE